MGIKNRLYIKIDAKKLIFGQLYLILYSRTLIYFVPALSIVNYFLDVINIILLFFLIGRLVKRPITSGLHFFTGFILFLLLFDIICFLLEGKNLILFLWGVRNQYRFIIFFLASLFFLKKNDLPAMFTIFYRCFIINMFAVTLEFAAGYRNDFLGGTFGLEHNCNGIINVFLCIMTSYAILGWLYKSVKKNKSMIVLIGSIYWSTLAELKIFFIELIIIFIIVMLIVKIKRTRKIFCFFIISFVLFMGIGILTFVYPDQIDYLLKNGLLGYLRDVNLGIHGFGRLSAIPITTKVFFENSIKRILVGIGTGNAEFMMVGKINILSEFYKLYSDYAYNCYLYAFIYIERGILGLIWYAILFSKSILYACKYRKKMLNDRLWFDLAICTTVCFFVMCIYDSSLRVSASGFLAFLILGLPYINAKSYLKEVRKINL